MSTTKKFTMYTGAIILGPDGVVYREMSEHDLPTIHEKTVFEIVVSVLGHIPDIETLKTYSRRLTFPKGPMTIEETRISFSYVGLDQTDLFVVGTDTFTGRNRSAREIPRLVYVTQVTQTT